MSKTNWPVALQPILVKYKGSPHPLTYENLYQLMVMVVLSAQSTDKAINNLAPALFEAFPDMSSLAKADEESLYPYVRKIRNFGNKSKWLVRIAQTLKEDKNIPSTMEALTALPGIGRKSANVIKREMGVQAEGIGVDLHVVRVAPRIGIVSGDKPEQIEKQIMAVMPEKYWSDIGMAISFLGREICRPTNPNCRECPLQGCCLYYKENFG